MISKYYEINKHKDKINFYLFYGENEGLKLDTIKTKFNNFTKENTYKYSEKDIIQNKQSFFEKIYSKSFFENEKLILISNVTDKSFELIQEMIRIQTLSIKCFLDFEIQLLPRRNKNLKIV